MSNWTQAAIDARKAPKSAPKPKAGTSVSVAPPKGRSEAEKARDKEKEAAAARELARPGRQVGEFYGQPARRYVLVTPEQAALLDQCFEAIIS